MTFVRIAAVSGVTALMLTVSPSRDVLAAEPGDARGTVSTPSTPLVEAVRTATERFRDPAQAEGAGYGAAFGCVSGPEEGAMGVHFVNGALVGDGRLDPSAPEALLYEIKNGRARLLGVEFIVMVADWHKHHKNPPALLGQAFQLVGSPNRFALPPFYELHVWAWKDNPNGTFVDWNPRVSCDGFGPDSLPQN